jgi:hypothetical protein
MFFVSHPCCIISKINHIFLEDMDVVSTAINTVATRGYFSTIIQDSSGSKVIGMMGGETYFYYPHSFIP